MLANFLECTIIKKISYTSHIGHLDTNRSAKSVIMTRFVFYFAFVSKVEKMSTFEERRKKINENG